MQNYLKLFSRCNVYKMSNPFGYEIVKQTFANEKCRLLNSYDEYLQIKEDYKGRGSFKLDYIASCGHEHNVYFNVFKNRKTGVICPACAITRNKGRMKEKLQKDKTEFLRLEYDCIQYFKGLLQHQFDVVKAFDGCKVDVIFKPKSVIEDEWIGIQFKTTHKSKRGYGFHLRTGYDNFIVFCVCGDDKRMWAIPYEHLNGVHKIAIGDNKSKYDQYEVTKNNIANRMMELYNSTPKFDFETLDTPVNIYQQREKEFRKYREAKIDFLTFTNGDMEGTVVDFIIEPGIKVQEKVGGFVKKGNPLFGLAKNNGRRDDGKHKTSKQYDIGDNYIYWLNCEDKKYFYVIPEYVLIEKQFIGNSTEKTHMMCLPKIENQLKNPDFWTNPYLFDYDNIDKVRLLGIIDEVTEYISYQECDESESESDESDA